MSDYSKITNFLSKDSLSLNDPAKYVKGSEIDAEYNAIAVAIATKADTASPTLTTPTMSSPTITGTITAAIANFSGLVTAALGLTVSGAAFNSRGITDNATAKALTLSGSGANSVTIANSATNPTIGTSAGNLILAPAGLRAVSIEAPATSVNYISISGSVTGASCVIRPNSDVDTNINLTIDSKGSGQISFRTDPYGTPATQAVVIHTASANRYLTLTGSFGGNPTIGTNAGSLSLTSAVVTTSTLTVGTNLFANGYGQVNSNDATPAGGGGDHGIFIGSGAIGITVGSGLPTSTVADGSIYIRTDGGAGTTIYQRRVGNWIATAA